MSASMQDVVKGLEALGLTAQILPRGGEAINVWVGNTELPDATVWPPKGDDGWVWGHSWEWGVHADADADAVARWVGETLPSAGSVPS